MLVPGPLARRRPARRDRARGPRHARHLLRRLPRLRAPDVVLHLRAFDEHGLAVELTHGRVSAVYTLWSPAGWHDANGLVLGAPRGDGARLRAGPLLARSPAPATRRSPRATRDARTAYYLVDGRLWGFGLFRARSHAVPVSRARGRRSARRGGSTASRTARPSSPRARSTSASARRVHVKAECFQRGGAFKFRGAYNKISSLDEDALRRGVLAYSSGNHAQAVAIAARLLGSRATILMPEDAPAAKLDATRGYGAEVVTYDRWTESREEIGERARRRARARARAAVRRPARHGRPGDRRARAARATCPTSTCSSSRSAAAG